MELKRYFVLNYEWCTTLFISIENALLYNLYFFIKKKMNAGQVKNIFCCNQHHTTNAADWA